MTDATKQSDKSSVRARLKELLKEISTFIDNAPEQYLLTLLGVFEDWRFQAMLQDWRQEDQIKQSGEPGSTAITRPTEDRAFKDFIGNIGTGGMFIETPASFSVGQDITLIFSPTTEQGPVKITGKIVWRIPKGIGVRFASASDDLEDMLQFL